jgi:hypothetical protein
LKEDGQKNQRNLEIGKQTKGKYIESKEDKQKLKRG